MRTTGTALVVMALLGISSPVAVTGVRAADGPVPRIGTVPPPSPTVTPTSCIAEWAWLSRDLPARAVAGTPFAVHYKWRGGTARIRRIEETLPAGWQVLSPPWTQRSGDTYVWDTWVSYGFSVWQIDILPPRESPSGDYRFSGSTISWHSCNGEVGWGIEGASTVRVEPWSTPCTGDCRADGAVTVDDLLVAVGVALGETVLGMCPAADPNGDGTVTVDEIVMAVGMAVGGCPAVATGS